MIIKAQDMTFKRLDNGRKRREDSRATSRIPGLGGKPFGKQGFWETSTR